jgi:hypothetical protein
MPTPSYPQYVQRELAFPGVIKKGDSGANARRVQEWLSYHKFATTIDGGFGDATELRVKQFQTAKGITSSGKVDSKTWDALVAPLARALAPINPAGGANLADVTLAYARQHVRERPVELGGDNRGAWVRVYMAGNQGESWLWCAGFVTFILKQASDTLGQAMPIAGSFGCDALAYQAKAAGRFVPGSSVASGSVSWPSLHAAQIFLVRRTATDWVHTGFSFGGNQATFSTFEGNTNDNGSPNGFEACERVRSVTKKDFITLA